VNLILFNNRVKVLSLLRKTSGVSDTQFPNKKLFGIIALTIIVLLFHWLADSNRKAVSCHIIRWLGSSAERLHSSTYSRCCEL